MTKIIKSLAIIAFVAAVAIGGTYAWLQQTETISSITYSTASLDLKIDSYPDPAKKSWVDSFDTQGAFNKTGLKPGLSGEQIIDIQSLGDIGTKASIRLSLTSNAENGVIGPETAAGDTPDNGQWDGELAQNIRVKISYDGNNDGGFDSPAYDYTLAEYHANPNQLLLGEVTGPDTTTSRIASVKLEWSIPADADNKIMTDSAGINVIFGLE